LCADRGVEYVFESMRCPLSSRSRRALAGGPVAAWVSRATGLRVSAAHRRGITGATRVAMRFATGAAAVWMPAAARRGRRVPGAARRSTRRTLPARDDRVGQACAGTRGAARGRQRRTGTRAARRPASVRSGAACRSAWVSAAGAASGWEAACSMATRSTLYDDAVFTDIDGKARRTKDGADFRSRGSSRRPGSRRRAGWQRCGLTSG